MANTVDQRLADLERHSHEPQAIRPRVLDVLEEFGLVSFKLMTPEDREAVRRFRETGTS